MNTFYIITNEPKDPGHRYTNRIRSYLEAKGKRCYIHEPVGAEQLAGCRYTNASLIPEDVECVLVLGGDGTLLQAARDLMERDLPLLGINLGTLGYLAEIEIQNVEAALDRLMEGNFSIEERMMLRGNVLRQERVILTDASLNDIAIVRRGRLRVVDFNIYVNDIFLCAYRADGIVLATPTGSTGYSLSAGGPIVSPDASLMVMTAIAPHTLNTRPVILPDHVKVTVEIGGSPERSADGAEVIFDGDTALNVSTGDQICVTRSEVKARLVKIHHTSFVEMLRNKMN